MSSEAGDAGSGVSSQANGHMELVDVQFNEGFQFRPWKDKARGKEWVQEDVLSSSSDTKDGVAWKILFGNKPLQLTVYLENLSSDVVTDIVIPRIRMLVGPDGKVRRYCREEADARISRDQCWKLTTEARSKAVGGDLEGVASFLKTAMSWQGPVDEASPSKRQKRMSSQLVDTYWTAQQIAKSGLRTKALHTEEA